jgi:hypothetical protein
MGSICKHSNRSNLVFGILSQRVVFDNRIRVKLWIAVTFGDVPHTFPVEIRKRPHPGTFQSNQARLVVTSSNRPEMVKVVIVVDKDDEWVVNECK